MSRSGRVGLLPAAFNPPTVAHLGLAEAAQRQRDLDEVVFVLPKVFPHKKFDQVDFEQRRAMLEAAVARQAEWSVWTSNGGLFLEIAREYRQLRDPDAAIAFLCGRDAGERIVHWDYGDLPPIDEQLREFEMIVAPREGAFEPPAELAGRIHPIELDEDLQAISSSRVRQAMASGEPWQHLVPAPVAGFIYERGLYRPGAPRST